MGKEASSENQIVQINGHGTPYSHLLLDKLPYGVLFIEGRRVVDCNPAALRMFNLQEKSQLLGQDVAGLLGTGTRRPDDDRDQFVQLLEDSRISGHSQGQWFLDLGGNGHYVKVDVLVVSIEATEQEYYYVQIQPKEEVEDNHDQLIQEGVQHQQLFEKFPEPIAIIDQAGMIIRVNQSFCTTFGYSADEINGKTLHETILPVCFMEEPKSRQSKILKGESVQVEGILRKKDGTEVSMLIEGIAVSDGQGGFVIATIFLKLVNDSRHEGMLRTFQRVMERSPEGMVITDDQVKIQWVNDAFEKITGYSREELLGKNPRILKSGRHEKKFYEEMWHQLLTHRQWQGEIWNMRKNGEMYPQELKLIAIENQQGEITHYAGITNDITVSKKREERINYLAFRDSLTGLYNRTMFNDRLHLELAKAKRYNHLVAIFFIDLDRFKYVNDNHGHQMGDLLLKLIAERLLSSTRETDMVARVGGDEFILILSEINTLEQIKTVAEKLIRVFKDPWQVGDKRFHIGASVGISIYPWDGMKPHELIEFADLAMYQAKEKGHNQYEFYHNIKA